MSKSNKHKNRNEEKKLKKAFEHEKGHRQNDKLKNTLDMIKNLGYIDPETGEYSIGDRKC